MGTGSVGPTNGGEEKRSLGGRVKRSGELRPKKHETMAHTSWEKGGELSAKGVRAGVQGMTKKSSRGKDWSKKSLGSPHFRLAMSPKKKKMASGSGTRRLYRHCWVIKLHSLRRRPRRAEREWHLS